MLRESCTSPVASIQYQGSDQLKIVKHFTLFITISHCLELILYDVVTGYSHQRLPSSLRLYS